MPDSQNTSQNPAQSLWQKLSSLRFGRFTAAALVAFALIASFQAFASSGEYAPGAEPSLVDKQSWSAPGRYFLDCQVVGGSECLTSNDDLGVFAKENYTVTFRSTLLQAGRYKLRFDYQNYDGNVPAGYEYQVVVKLNGRAVTVGPISLNTGGESPWVFSRVVELPKGESTISIQWLNDREQRGSATNFGVISAALISQDAEAVSQRNDTARKRDLAAYRAALARTIADTGKYPVQRSVAAVSEKNQPFQSVRSHGVGNFLGDPLAGTRHYYYVSDGVRYGLCADLEGTPGTRLEAGPSGIREMRGAAAECKLRS